MKARAVDFAGASVRNHRRTANRSLAQAQTAGRGPRNSPVLLAPDVTVAVRLDRSNERPLDYYILPSIDMNTGRIRMAEDNALSLDAYRFESLDFLYSMAAQTSFREAA